MEMAVVILFVGLLVFLAHAFTAVFEKTRVPDVLPLVVLGLIVGPLAGLVKPEHFGQVGHVFTTVALIVILFESGLGLAFSSLREALGPMLWLTVVSFVLTMFAVAALAVPLLLMPFLPALTLGAIVGGTSSGVVIPLVAKLRLQPTSRTVLVLESTFSDVLCIVVTLGLLEAIRLHELRFGLMLGQMLSAFLMAGLIGGVGALIWSAILGKVRGLQNSIFTTPAFVFVLYGVTEFFGYSGAIAALGFGIVLGNIEIFRRPISRLIQSVEPVRLNDTERAFFAEIVFLIKTFFFVYIGLSIRLTDWKLMLIGLLLSLWVFAVRIPAVRLTVSKQVPKLDASLMAVLVPKGLAPAVLASIPLQQGLPEGAAIQGLTYAMILFTIIVSAALCFLLERRGLLPPYKGVFAGYAATPQPASGSGGN